MRWDRTAQIHVNANGRQGSWWRKSLKRQADSSASARGREVNLATNKLDSKSPICLIVVPQILPGQLCSWSLPLVIWHFRQQLNITLWRCTQAFVSTSTTGAPSTSRYDPCIICWMHFPFMLAFSNTELSEIPWSHTPLSNKNNFPISHQILAGWEVQTSSPPTVSGLALKRLGFCHGDFT